MEFDDDCLMCLLSFTEESTILSWIWFYDKLLELTRIFMTLHAGDGSRLRQIFNSLITKTLLIKFIL